MSNSETRTPACWFRRWDCPIERSWWLRACRPQLPRVDPTTLLGGRGHRKYL